MANEFRERARRLRSAVEPVAAGVYFAPEAHAAHAHSGSRAARSAGTESPDLN